MLAPRETSTRERKSLDGLWRFALGVDGVGRGEGWWQRPLPGVREVPVPSSYNDVFPDAEVRDHVGDAWYQTTVRVPARLGRPADPPAVRLGHPSGGRVGRRRPGRRARGRFHPLRGRRHQRRRAGRRRTGSPSS